MAVILMTATTVVYQGLPKGASCLLRFVNMVLGAQMLRKYLLND